MSALRPWRRFRLSCSVGGGAADARVINHTNDSIGGSSGWKAGASEDTFTVRLQRVITVEAANYRWSVYLMRTDLARHAQPRALKIGMVGSGTIAQRRKAQRGGGLGRSRRRLPDRYVVRVIDDHCMFARRVVYLDHVVIPAPNVAYFL